MPNENDSEFLELLEDASNGNIEAYKTLKIAVTYFHNFDDLIDKDVELNTTNLAACTNMMLRLTLSPFFLQYKEVLIIIIMLCGEDYNASNEDKKWEILRHCGNNFIRTIALITGGEQLLISISKRLREFSLRDHYTKEGISI